MTWITYDSRTALFAGAAARIAGDITAALTENSRISIAVPGGTTPGPVFDDLAQRALDWARVTVMLSDERWVPADHERSNAGLLRARLLTDRAAAAEFVAFFEEGDVDQQVAQKASQILQSLPLDVLVLGMGGDMHTASLFPNAPGLDAALTADAPALVTLRPEDQPDIRVSLSGRVLSSAARKHLLITGADKKAAFERAAELPVAQAPINVARDGLTVHWAE